MARQDKINESNKGRLAMSGVYRIVNKINGKSYVGSSTNIGKRFREHRSGLVANKHYNGHLQNSWNKYGADKFRFDLLVELDCSEPVLRIIEDMYLNNLEPEYNIAKFATRNPMWGRKHTAETKEKLRVARTGTKASGELKKRLSVLQAGKNNGFYGKKHTEKTKLKMREGSHHISGEDHYLYGGRHAAESKRKMSEGAQARRLRNAEVIEIRRLYSTGKVTHKVLGKMFMVGRRHIGDIINRVCWRHI